MLVKRCSKSGTRKSIRNSGAARHAESFMVPLGSAIPSTTLAADLSRPAGVLAIPRFAIFVSGLSERAATPSQLLAATAATVRQPATKTPTNKQATKPPVSWHSALYETSICWKSAQFYAVDYSLYKSRSKGSDDAQWIVGDPQFARKRVSGKSVEGSVKTPVQGSLVKLRMGRWPIPPGC